jgi:flagellar hook-associated protein 1 FlgK
MAGLITDLLSSSQALAAQQAGLQVVSNNLANVNTPGYSRQSIVLGSAGVMNSPIGEVSMGVSATGIQQARNPFLDAQVTQELSQTAILQSQDTQLQQAQANLGETVSSTSTSASIDSTSQSTTGISSALNNFFNSFTALASSPTNTGDKQVVVQTAGTLVNTINNADSALSSLQSSITAETTQDVGTANGLLKQIAQLNGQIQQYEIQGNGSANDLVDQRQSDLEQLAGYMNFTTSNIPGTDGQIAVTALDASSNPVTLVSKTTVEGSGITFDGTNFSGGSPSTQLAFTGGSLQGNITARDGDIQTLRNNLATTSSQLTTAVNAAYNPTGTTGNFFQTTPSSGQLITLDPTLSVSTLKSTNTGDAGANELALAVSNVATQTFSTAGGDQINGTIGGFYAQAVTSLGESITGVESQLTDQTNVQNMVQTQQASVSGVDQDQELTNLLTFQRAFQAQARVMNTVNDLLDVVVNGLFGSPTN